ncbi:MAG: hypothetical protein A2089_12605 [Elusimicrobia bacterium GWD2_63_28]|nr:MAG: hypothetical protein A2089_12605 [Elusimicrobia bacterium GWD2_63_28]
MIKCRAHLNNVARTRQDYLTRQGLVRLGMNEYVPAMPAKLFRAVMRGFSRELASSYPETKRAYIALSRFIGQPEGRLIMTSGADMGIRMTLETFCAPGDTVATLAPTFAMYEVHSSLLACRYKTAVCDAQGAYSDGDLLSLSEMGAKAIVLANPNGVTGFEFSLERLRPLAAKAARKDTLLLIDETYADFGTVDASPLIEEFPNVVIVRSFSKNVGLAGVRAGYILAGERLARMIEKNRPMMELNSLAVAAVSAVCADKRLFAKTVSEITTAREEFASRLKRMGLTVISRSGNFVLVDPGIKRAEILSRLDRHRVEYKRLSAPLKGFIRVTAGSRAVMRSVARLFR